MIGVLISRFVKTPLTLLLIDAIGATVTAFSSGIILPRFENELGIPRSLLFLLCLIACLYAVFSFSCYLSKRPARLCLRIIAIANLFYCCLLIACIEICFRSVSTVAVIYFSTEILVIAALAFVEYHVSRKITSESRPSRTDIL